MGTVNRVRVANGIGREPKVIELLSGPFLNLPNPLWRKAKGVRSNDTGQQKVLFKRTHHAIKDLDFWWIALEALGMFPRP